MTTLAEVQIEARSHALITGLERDGVRLFRLVVGLCVIVALAGTFGFVALVELTHSNRQILQRIKADQDRKIAVLERQVEIDRSVEDQMVAYIVDLARKAKAAGVDPGELIIHPPAAEEPSP